MRSTFGSEAHIMSKQRIEAFSDNVFAVILTILVLDIHPPHWAFEADKMAATLLDRIPNILTYVMSFTVVTSWWVSHHQLFHLIRASDRMLLWINALFLLFLSFTPFPTALLGTHPTSSLAIAVYGLTGMLTAFSFILLRWYASFRGHIVGNDLARPVFSKAIQKGSLSLILYGLASLCGIWVPWLSLMIFAGIPIFYFFNGLLGTSPIPTENAQRSPK
jgi:uncharacterized membrane protein